MAGKTFRLPPIAPKLKIEPPKVYQSLGADPEVGFQVSDATGIIDTLLNLPQVAMDAAGYEMAKMAQETIQLAQSGYVPIDTGNLNDSGDWDEYEPNRGQTLAQIACWFAGDVSREQALHGRTTSPQKYALDQHENFTYRHPRGGGPKYLEKPFMEKSAEMASRIAGAISEALGTGLLSYLLGGPNDANIAPVARPVTGGAADRFKV